MTSNQTGFKVLRALVVAAITFVILWLGLRFLSNPVAFQNFPPTVSKLIQALIALVLGVVGI